jgi:hypothetical protein
VPEVELKLLGRVQAKRYPNSGCKDAEVETYLEVDDPPLLRGTVRLATTAANRFKGVVMTSPNPNTFEGDVAKIAGLKTLFFETPIATRYIPEGDVGQQVRHVMSDARNIPRGVSVNLNAIANFGFGLGKRFPSAKESVGDFLDAVSSALPAFTVPLDAGDIAALAELFPEIVNYIPGEFVPGVTWDTDRNGALFFRRPSGVLQLQDGVDCTVIPLKQLEAEKVIQRVQWELGQGGFQAHGKTGVIYDRSTIIAGNPSPPVGQISAWGLQETYGDSAEPVIHSSFGPAYETYGGGYEAFGIDPKLGLKAVADPNWILGLNDGSYNAYSLDTTTLNQLRPNNNGLFTLSTQFKLANSISSFPVALGFNVKASCDFGWVIYPIEQIYPIVGTPLLTAPSQRLVYNPNNDPQTLDNTVGDTPDQTGDGAYIFFSGEDMRKESENAGNAQGYQGIFQLDITFYVGTGQTANLEHLYLLEANRNFLDRVAYTYYTTPELNPRLIRCFGFENPAPVIELTPKGGGTPETIYPSLFTDLWKEDAYEETYVTVGLPDNPDEIAMRQLLEDIIKSRDEGKL